MPSTETTSSISLVGCSPPNTRCVAMTRQRGQPTTYDQMMAELQHDSDDDEKITDSRPTLRDNCRRSTLPSKQHEDWSQRPEKYAAVERRQEGELQGSHEADKKDSSRRRHFSFPRRSDDASPPRRSSRSFSRSEGEIPNDSDDSDHEQEGTRNYHLVISSSTRDSFLLIPAARVVNINRELFGAAGCTTNDSAFTATARRGAIDGMRAFIMRAPAKGTPAIRVRMLPEHLHS